MQTFFPRTIRENYFHPKKLNEIVPNNFQVSAVLAVLFFISFTFSWKGKKINNLNWKLASLVSFRKQFFVAIPLRCILMSPAYTQNKEAVCATCCYFILHHLLSSPRRRVFKICTTRFKLHLHCKNHSKKKAKKKKTSDLMSNDAPYCEIFFLFMLDIPLS